jgi:hypothetical protein
MKHFLVILALTASRPDIGPRLLAQHDRHFHAGQDLALFLCHGRCTPGEGYLALARSRSLETLHAFLQEDPLVAEGLATLEVLEFEPAEFPEVLRGWMHPMGLGSELEPANGFGAAS